jgi:hypothetical protein
VTKSNTAAIHVQNFWINFTHCLLHAKMLLAKFVGSKSSRAANYLGGEGFINFD